MTTVARGVAAMIATAVAILAFAAATGLAADYQDKFANVCEGNLEPTWCAWTETGFDEHNTALGAEAMPKLKGTLDFDNVAVGWHALVQNEGSSNTAVGTEADELGGAQNTAVGREALKTSSGKNNVGVGIEALAGNSGEDNIGAGFEALLDNGGNFNIGIGHEAISSSEGSNNIAIGYQAGSSEHSSKSSDNVDIANVGAEGDEHTTRIGTEDVTARAFVAGVYGRNPPGAVCSVGVNSEGQLGCAPAEASGGAVATFNSFSAVPSGTCLNYAENAPAGHSTCPAETAGFSRSKALAGPTPGGGATPSNLFADTNARVEGSDAVLIAVVDNTTGATLISCSVDSTTVNECSATSGTGSAGPGDNIEVKVTAPGRSGDHKSWRVTFRY